MMIRPPQPQTNMQFNSLTSISPSFTSHSSNNLADIAARVVEEFRNENRHLNDEEDIYNFVDDDSDNVYLLPVDNKPEGNMYIESSIQNDVNQNMYIESSIQNDENQNMYIESSIHNDENQNEVEDQEFEFAVCTDNNSSTVSPDLIFFNGEILPRYPLFDRSLLPNDIVEQISSNSNSKPVLRNPVRQPLRKLFNEERETTSCSSSEADDLDGVSPETYCIWKPKVESANDSVNASVNNTTKSNSTGSSSKRWKFRNLVHRSHSDIRETAGKTAPVIIFRPLTSKKKKTEKVKKVEKTAKVAGADDDVEDNSVNKTVKEGDRVRSYLPYKRDLVGVFGNVNGLSRNLHPF